MDTKQSTVTVQPNHFTPSPSPGKFPSPLGKCYWDTFSNVPFGLLEIVIEYMHQLDEVQNIGIAMGTGSGQVLV